MKSWITLLLFVTAQSSCAENGADVYQYTAEVKAEVHQPVQFESSSKVHADLLVQQKTSNSDSKSYIIKLQNVVFSEYNGRFEDKNSEITYSPQNIEAIKKPFFVVYGKDGQFQGLKFMKDDANWSKNVKLSIASGLQYNRTAAKQSKSTFSFFTTENTIHGKCRVSNDFITKSQINADEKILRITKNYIPKYCSDYPREMFDVAFDRCFRQLADDNISSVNKILEIHVKGTSTKLIKYEGDEIETRMPFLHKSDALLIRTKHILVYKKTIKNQEFSESLFKGESLVQDVTYDRTTAYVADGARNDITQGRHHVEKRNVSEVIQLLKQSRGYLKSNRFVKEDPDLKKGNNINEIMDALLFFDYKSIKDVWIELNSVQKTDEIAIIRKIFLDILCYVGTDASATTIRDAIQSDKISDAEASDVLAKFPQFIMEPKEKLLQDMEGLLHLDEKISHDIKKASILGFASLVFRSYEKSPQRKTPENLEKYLKYFNDKLEDSIKDNDTEMILVYIMAFQNIKVGHIERFLWPILRKDVKIRENSDRIRVATAFAIFGGISHDHELVHNVYFPIFSDKTEFTPLRTVCFLRLMYVTQLGNQRRPMEMYWQYVRETDPIMRNLESSKILSYANFGTPCRQTIREMYEKIVRFVEPEKVNYSMPSVRFVDYAVNKYAYAEAMIEYMLKSNEDTGLTDIGAFIYNIADGRRPGPFVQLYWMVEELDKILLNGLKYFSKDHPNIQKLLDKYQSASAKNTKDTLTLIPFYGFQATQVYYYDKKASKEKKEQFWKQVAGAMNITTIFYGEFRESTVGTDIGVPDYFRHHEPSLLSSKVNFNARLEDRTIHLNLQAQYDYWSVNSYDLTIYNSIADIFHTVRRSTFVDIVLLHDIDISYHLETKILKIVPSDTLDNKDLRTKLSTYSKVYSIKQNNNNSNDSLPYSTLVVTKGKDRRKTYQSTFESNLTSVKYNMDIYNCETGFNPDVDNEEWLEAIHNRDRNNLFGPQIEEILVGKQKFAIDMMSPRPGICGVLKEYLPIPKNESSYVEIKLH